MKSHLHVFHLVSGSNARKVKNDRSKILTPLLFTIFLDSSLRMRTFSTALATVPLAPSKSSRKIYRQERREGGRGKRRERWKEITYNFSFFQRPEEITVLYLFNCSLQTQEKVRSTICSVDYQKKCPFAFLEVFWPSIEITQVNVVETLLLVES